MKPTVGMKIRKPGYGKGKVIAVTEIAAEGYERIGWFVTLTKWGVPSLHYLSSRGGWYVA